MTQLLVLAAGLATAQPVPPVSVDPNKGNRYSIQEDANKKLP
jgi:hypothetical protein